MNYIRIRFQLGIKLSQKFEDAAIRHGTPKAKLLRNWLLSLNPAKNLPNSAVEQQLTSFNLRLPDDTYQKLELASQKSGLSKSSYIRNLINFYVNQELVENPSIPINSNPLAFYNKLWKERPRQETLKSYIENADTLDDYELSALTKTSLQLGELSKAKELLRLLEQRVHSQTDSLLISKFYMSKSTLARLERNLNSCIQFLQLALQYALEAKEAPTLSTIYSQLGVIEAIRDNFQIAVEYVEKSLEFINIMENSIRYYKAYLRLADLYLQLDDRLNSEKYYRKAIELEAVIPQDEHLVAFGNDRKGIIEMKLGNLYTAKSLLDKAVSLNLANEGSQVELHYNFDTLGKIHILENDFGKAHQYFCKAVELELKFRTQESFSRSQLYKLFIEAKDNRDSYRKLQDMKFKNKGINTGLMQYLIATAQYLYGFNEHEQIKGKNGLTYLEQHGSYPLLRLAAQKTILDRKLRMVL